MVQRPLALTIHDGNRRVNRAWQMPRSYDVSAWGRSWPQAQMRTWRPQNGCGGALDAPRSSSSSNPLARFSELGPGINGWKRARKGDPNGPEKPAGEGRTA